MEPENGVAEGPNGAAPGIHPGELEGWAWRPARPPFAAVLAEAGIATGDQLKEAFAEGMRTGEQLGEVVVRRGWATEDELARLLARQWELPFLDNGALAPDPAVAALLSVADARRLAALPIAREGGRLVVAVAEPIEQRLAAVRSLIGQEVSFVVVAKSVLERLLTAEEPSVAGDEPAQAGDLAELEGIKGELEALVGELEAGTTSLASLLTRLERLADTLRRTEHELAQCRERLAALDAAREQDRETIRRLEAELAQRGDLVSTTRAKLAELMGTLEASG